MNQITLLEFCQVPENRIKLMEEIINHLKSKSEYYICLIINYDFIKFKQDNNIEKEGYCIASIEEKGDIRRSSYFLLSDLLPELVKYKNIPPQYIKDKSVWFYSTKLCDSFEVRIEALTNAINDIKNNLA